MNTKSEKPIATFVRKLTDFRGDARLFKLSKPFQYDRYDPSNKKEIPVVVEFVVVSGIDTSSIHELLNERETYIFAANSKGEISDWLELKGSFKGKIDHAQALKNMGYKTVPTC